LFRKFNEHLKLKATVRPFVQAQEVEENIKFQQEYKRALK